MIKTQKSEESEIKGKKSRFSSTGKINKIEQICMRKLQTEIRKIIQHPKSKIQNLKSIWQARSDLN